MYFDKVIKMNGFVRNGEETYIYKWAIDSVVIFFVLYVDDILLLRNDIPTLQSVKLWLSSQFSMKDLREIFYILGMKIYRDRSRKLLRLTQSTYIDILLKRFNIDKFKKGYLSIGHGITLSKKDCPTTPEKRQCMSKIPYALAVGSIMYAMTYTRSDVAYSLRIVSRYHSDSDEKHWKIAKAILKYLRNTKDQ